ncbi:hypothetical protein ACN47E_006074 [Coniothyrium glycines]
MDNVVEHTGNVRQEKVNRRARMSLSSQMESSYAWTNFHDRASEMIHPRGRQLFSSRNYAQLAWWSRFAMDNDATSP